MSQSSPTHSPQAVWDPWIRLFHWSLVLAITVAALTGFLADATWLRLHITGGLAAAALVLARITWGFTGPTHARFADFVPRPAEIVDHLRGRGRRHLGHNPLGAMMVLALIAAILGLAATGTIILGGLLRTGPLAHDLGTSTGLAARDLHAALATGLLALVGLHLAGVLAESLRSRENLFRAMVTGRKEPRPDDAPARQVTARGTVALGVVAVTAIALVASNAALSARPVPGLPAMPVAGIVADECGACHMVYHPSLLPAASWSGLVATLSEHFGEDASLDPEVAAAIEDWLAGHASETVDTLPARALSRTDPEAPFSLTAAPFWKRTHAQLPEETFLSPAVGSRGNCAACHRDAASGLFSPFAIAIATETSR